MIHPQFHVALDILSHDSDSAHEDSDHQTPTPLSIDQKTLTTPVRQRNNILQKPTNQNLLGFVLEALKDTIITMSMLLFCAVLLIGVGFMAHDPKERWSYGTAITFVIFFVIFIGVLTYLFKQSHQFRRYSCSGSSSIQQVEVPRDGGHQRVPIFEIPVGDSVLSSNGDQVPADELLLDDQDDHCSTADESSMTGGSDCIEIKVANNPFLNEKIPIQRQLSMLNLFVNIVAVVVAFPPFVALLTSYSIRQIRGEETDEDRNQGLADVISTAVTILVAGLPLSLPLTRGFTMAKSMKKIMAAKATVRNLSACGPMASATIITDKTGTLTLNQMEVTEFWQGRNAVETPLNFQNNNIIVDRLQQAAGLNINSTGSVDGSSPGSASEVSGSAAATEEAILRWASSALGLKRDALMESFEVMDFDPFNSDKRSRVVVKKRGESREQEHWKGEAEKILGKCCNYYDQTGMPVSIDNEVRREFKKIIRHMTKIKGLRCIAFAHKEQQIRGEHNDESRLSLLGIVGLKHPCRPGVEQAVESCREAGVNVKMVTMDDILTARAIAIECGILAEDEILHGDAVMDARKFRNYSKEERMERIDHVKVMARSSPSDKLLMVQCLKQQGHVVTVVTSNRMKDAPALKEADIGCCESTNDNFASAVTILSWGRRVHNNVQKLIQFQLTVNAVAVIVNIVAVFSSGNLRLSAFELLWVNLIITILGAIPLFTEYQPSTANDIMSQASGENEPKIIFTGQMLTNIIGQARYQILILITLQFKGVNAFEDGVLDTVFFNIFVLFQVFNVFNAWKFMQEDILKGIRRSIPFLGAIGVIILVQVAIVQLQFEGTQMLNWKEWFKCIIIAADRWVPSSIFQFWNPVSS